MNRPCSLRSFAGFCVLVMAFQVDAAIENPDGTVSLSWSAEYIPFSWKFSVDPFPVRNGQLTLLWTDPERVEFLGVQPTDDYEVLSQGQLLGQEGLLTNIRFLASTSNLPEGSANVFEATFFDEASAQAGAPIFPGPVFTVLATDGEGFNYPVDPLTGLPDWTQVPEIRMDEIEPFAAQAPVPEPGSFLLTLVAGVLGLGVLRCARCRKA